MKWPTVWSLWFQTTCNCVKSQGSYNSQEKREFACRLIWKISNTPDQVIYTKYSKHWLYNYTTRRLMGSTDQADPSCMYFRITWILMKRLWFYFFCPLHLLQGLRSLRNWLHTSKIKYEHFGPKILIPHWKMDILVPNYFKKLNFLNT